MAQAVEVCRQNAIANCVAEDELRASREKAKSALLEISLTLVTNGQSGGSNQTADQMLDKDFNP